MKYRFKNRLILYGSIIIMLSYAHAGIALDRDHFIVRQKAFISDLFNNKRYFDCIAETQRLLSYDNKIENKAEYTYLINVCYYSGGQYKTVISRLRPAEYSGGAELRAKDLLLLSGSYYNAGFHREAGDALFETDYSGIGQSYTHLLFLGRVEFFLRNYEYEDILSEIDYAGEYMRKSYPDFPVQDFRNDILKYHETGLKSEWLSVSLSALLPGAGQVYSGKILDGIISFAAVAGTAFGAYYFYRKDEIPLAITFTFFAGLFYSGNIYGAYNSAQYTNLKLNQKFSDQIIEKYDLNYNPSDYIGSGIIK